MSDTITPENRRLEPGMIISSQSTSTEKDRSGREDARDALQEVISLKVCATVVRILSDLIVWPEATVLD
jgi:hypothetical protein